MTENGEQTTGIGIKLGFGKWYIRSKGYVATSLLTISICLLLVVFRPSVISLFGLGTTTAGAADAVDVGVRLDSVERDQRGLAERHARDTELRRKENEDTETRLTAQVNKVHDDVKSVKEDIKGIRDDITYERRQAASREREQLLLNSEIVKALAEIKAEVLK